MEGREGSNGLVVSLFSSQQPKLPWVFPQNPKAKSWKTESPWSSASRLAGFEPRLVLLRGHQSPGEATLDRHILAHRLIWSGTIHNAFVHTVPSDCSDLNWPTCHTGHPQCLLVLGRLGAVLAALLAPSGPDAPQMDLCGLEERDHEGLLVLRSVPPNQARQFGVDALPCRGGVHYRGVGTGKGWGEIPSSPDNLFMAIRSPDKDYLDNSRSYFRGILFSGDPGRQHIIISGDPNTKMHEDPGQDLRGNSG